VVPLRIATSLERSHPAQIHFKRYRPLQQRHGKDNAMIALKVDQNSLETRQLAGMDPDPFADFKVWPWLPWNLRSNSQLNGLNFPILDGYWRPATADNLQNSGSYYRWPPL
jgi:hypothetical protein